MEQNRWVAVCLALAVSVSAYAQRFAESVEVTIVEVPVKVVDRSGNPVRDLTKEDFELYDDGKRVPIEYFEVVDMQHVAAEAEKTHTPLPPFATRHFLLLFDVANSVPGTVDRAREAAKQFVNSQLGATDLAAVAVFTAESGARMITSFTRNRVLLDAAIETLGHPKFFKVADPLMISAITSGGGTGEGEGAGQDRAAAAAEDAADFNRINQTNADNEARSRLRIELANFGTVARTLDRLRGQKQIILLSEGFDARLVQGREDLGFGKTREEMDQVLSGESYKVNTDQRFGNTSATNDVSEMAQLFRRSDVVLHAIDIKGLRSQVDASSGSKPSSSESLHLLTTPTGGSVFKNANDLGEGFSKLLKQQEVVYILGFEARGNGKPGKFHDLKVKSKTRGAQLSYRPGYYETSKMTDLERTLSLAEILVTDAPIEDVRLSLSASALPGPSGKARVPVMVNVSGPSLLQEVAGKTATANLYLYAFDEQNQVADFLQQRISLDLTKAGDAVRGAGVRYFGTLHLPPGKYAIKSVVRVEETGRIGFFRDDIDVPSFDKATVLPPVLFTDPAKWVMLVGPSRGDDYAYPFSAGDAKYVPDRRPALDAGGAYKVALFLYRVPLENLQVEPAIVSENGSTSTTASLKLLGRTAADERGGVKLLFDFTPAGLPAGQHELRLHVTQKDGTQSTVTLPFRIL